MTNPAAPALLPSLHALVEKWKDEVHNYLVCDDDDCEECDRLVREGFVMCCDACYEPGSTDSLGWHLLDSGRVLCTICYEKEMP